MSVSTFNLTAFTALATADWMAVGDASDTTQSAHGSLDKITIPNFFASIPTPVNVTSASATALAVGRLGATTPAFTVDASTASQVAGLKVTGAATGGTVAVVVTDSGTDASLTVNAKGTGTIGIGSVSTGRVTITPVTTITGLVTLTAGVTGPLTVTTTNASGLAVGRQGATNPVLQVDASAATVVTGIAITGAASGGGVAVAAISSASNEALKIDAKGSGTITLGGTSTGAITLTRAVTASSTINSQTISASANFTGTVTVASTLATTNGALGIDVDGPTAVPVAGFTTRSVTIPSALTSVWPDGTNAAVATQSGANGEGSRLFLFTAYNGFTATTARLIFVTQSGSFASPTATASGTFIGQIVFAGYGTAYTTTTYGADITASATQTWTGSAGGTQITFNTTPNGSTTRATVLTLGQDASATFAGAVSGITTLAGTGAVTGFTSYTLANGNYYKATRNTSSSVINVLGFAAGTDNLVLSTGGATGATSFTVVNTGAAATLTVTDAGALTALTSITATTGFGCNGKSAQTSFASGGALNAYGAGANGLDTGANMSALHALVVAIRAALVANGIMS